jgi:hypothetical protein
MRDAVEKQLALRQANPSTEIGRVAACVGQQLKDTLDAPNSAVPSGFQERSPHEPRHHAWAEILHQWGQHGGGNGVFHDHLQCKLEGMMFPRIGQRVACEDLSAHLPDDPAHAEPTNRKNEPRWGKRHSPQR